VSTKSFGDLLEQATVMTASDVPANVNAVHAA
jgi:hypothetical protein